MSGTPAVEYLMARGPWAFIGASPAVCAQQRASDARFKGAQVRSVPLSSYARGVAVYFEYRGSADVHGSYQSVPEASMSALDWREARRQFLVSAAQADKPSHKRMWQDAAEYCLGRTALKGAAVKDEEES